jgi:ActR/RegA family two-component response regulator
MAKRKSKRRKLDPKAMIIQHTLKWVEMNHIRWVLRDLANGSKSDAAKILGIARRTLQRILGRDKRRGKRNLKRTK